MSETWWRGAAIYQVYLRSFADGNGDGIGDLAGLRARLPYLAELGVDAIWLNPWYPSPMRILWSIVLPVSRPILGVVSILSVVTVWKDFVWPLLVLPETDKMSISVGIASLSAQMPQNVLIASLVIASLPTILVFFVFQRSIMAGLTAGSLKG